MIEERERKVLNELKRIPKESVILIGAYAVNSYVPPRFSIDCDLFVCGKLRRVKKVLREDGFEETWSGKNITPYKGESYRFERKNEMISFDLLVKEIMDRNTGVSISSSLVEKYSKERFTIGRASPIKIKMKIVDPEILFVMKFISCRKQDVRDLFMLSNLKLNNKLICEIIGEKCPDDVIKKNAEYISRMIKDKRFRDSLQGVFGAIPNETFNFCSENLNQILKEIYGIQK